MKDVSLESNPMKLRRIGTSRLGWTVLTVLYAAIFLTILVLAYAGKLPLFLTQNDKLAHVVLYGIATFLGHRILRKRRIKLLTLTLPLFPLLFGIFTIAEELMQSLSPYRTLDAIDLVASFAGILLGYWLAERGK